MISFSKVLRKTSRSSFVIISIDIGFYLHNKAFEDELAKYNLDPGVGQLFKMAVLDQYNSEDRNDLDDRKVLSSKLEDLELTISKARKRLLKDEIDAEDFKAIQTECNEELRQLETQLAELPARPGELRTI